jgi:Spy/CpxP family protein refolding chaperone
MSHLKNIRKRYLRALIVALAIFFTVPALAQDGAKHDRSAMKEAIKEKILAKVLEVKHEKLRGELLMDDEQAKKFFSAYDPAEKDLVELVKQKQEQEGKLLKASQSENGDADVNSAIENIKGLNQKITDRYLALDNNLKSMLNPRQRAKLFAFEKRFNEQVKQKVREHIQDKVRDWKEKHPGERPFRKSGAPPAGRPKGKQ